MSSNGDYEATFHLKRPQPSLLAMLATGWTPIYPCHVPPAQMRQHPIGTGPFKFVDFKPNQSITVTRNSDYWKPGRPYLDGIEYRIIKDVSTRLLSFIAGKEDVYFGVTMPQLKDVRRELPQAICDMTIPNVSRNLLVNRDVAPFDNAATASGDDVEPSTGRRLSTSSPMAKGRSAASCSRRRRACGECPPIRCESLPGYDPDVTSSRAQARKIMEQLGYGPDKRLSVTVVTRNVQPYRDAAVILISQLKEIYIDADLNPIDTTQWYPTLMRKDYKVGVNVTETRGRRSGCGVLRELCVRCAAQLHRLLQSRGSTNWSTANRRNPSFEKRKKLVWEIERKLIDDDARPILFYTRAANCREPYVKGLTTMVNSIYNSYRFEDLWLDK